MVLPPIIANNPFLKLFRSEALEDAANEIKNSANTMSAGKADDVVEISEAARRKFEENLLADEKQARAVAQETGERLRNDESATLGLNPGFRA